MSVGGIDVDENGLFFTKALGHPVGFHMFDQLTNTGCDAGEMRFGTDKHIFMRVTFAGFSPDHELKSACG